MRIPLLLSGQGDMDGAKANRESQGSDGSVGRPRFTPTTRRRHQHSDHARIEEPDGDSLFGALNDDGSGSDAVGARGAHRLTTLKCLRQRAKDAAYRTPLWSKKRRRFTSSESLSSSNESDSFHSPMPFREMTAQSFSSRGHRSSRHPRRYRSLGIPSNRFTSDKSERAAPDATPRSGRDNAISDSRSGS
jgi:hypothetical protein